MLNAIAPPAVQGINVAAPQGTFDVPFQYPFNVTMTALQVLTGQIVSIFTEADFLLRGVNWTSTGTFSIQFQDGQGYYLQSALTFNTNFPATPGDPFPFFPEVLYPAGGRIFINITDTSNGNNVIQFLFIGVHRYSLTA